MWLMTKHGFYFIVQKQLAEFHIRARVRKDLENLVARVPLTDAKIHTSKEIDYTFRVIANQEEMRKAMQFFGETVDYSNFKNTVAKTTAQVEKLAVYERLWHMLLDKFGGYGKIAGQQRLVTL